MHHVLVDDAPGCPPFPSPLGRCVGLASTTLNSLPSPSLPPTPRPSPPLLLLAADGHSINILLGSSDPLDTSRYQCIFISPFLSQRRIISRTINTSRLSIDGADSRLCSQDASQQDDCLSKVGGHTSSQGSIKDSSSSRLFERPSLCHSSLPTHPPFSRRRQQRPRRALHQRRRR